MPALNALPEIDDNGRSLTPRQEAAAVRLAAGDTIIAAAKSAGAGEKTVRNWLESTPAFQRRITELRDQLTSETVGRLVSSMTSAADALREIVDDYESPPAVRIRAASEILTHAVRLRETAELAARVAALESVRGGT